MASFIVRPSNTDRDPFRVRLTAASLLGLKLKPGDTCEIQGPDAGLPGRKQLALAGEASGTGIKDSIVQTSRLLQEVYGFKLGDRITIARSSQSLPHADTVGLGVVGESLLDGADLVFWTDYARRAVGSLGDCLAVSQQLTLTVGAQVAEFVVDDVGSHGAAVARVTTGTRFHITTDQAADAVDVLFRPVHLGGVDQQVRQVQDVVSRICCPLVKHYYPRYRPVQGILLYGAKGTGKTAFIAALGDAGWTTVVDWQPGTRLTPSTAPCLIVVRSRYLGNKPTAGADALDELEQLFEHISGTPTLVVAETQHPNDIDQSLRSAHKFGAEIELPIPSAEQRGQILHAIRGDDTPTPGDEVLREMADRTHGYVGADLDALFRRVLEYASDRVASPRPGGDVAGERIPPDSTPALAPLSLTAADVDRALTEIRPSALQEIFLETPNVRWSDIGGQRETKRQLHNAVERPLKFAARMQTLGLQPKKGVLLYGPPGCSKTLLVRALATEAGLNFLAVKGAELISMYVGESERATREVFRKARAASPSIIFFDEIDAIASRGRHGSDLNVLTTLLNEMDGFEELRNVLVVAATNKPQDIDPALMRPGRFDNVVYIGPPDRDARREIFQRRLERVTYVSDVGLADDAHTFAAATDGFSGAEVVAICQTAGEYAFDQDRDAIHTDDVIQAIQHTPRSITAEMLSVYETWNRARMR